MISPSLLMTSTESSLELLEDNLKLPVVDTTESAKSLGVNDPVLDLVRIRRVSVVAIKDSKEHTFYSQLNGSTEHTYEP